MHPPPEGSKQVNQSPNQLLISILTPGRRDRCRYTNVRKGSIASGLDLTIFGFFARDCYRTIRVASQISLVYVLRGQGVESNHFAEKWFAQRARGVRGRVAKTLAQGREKLFAAAVL